MLEYSYSHVSGKKTEVVPPTGKRERDDWEVKIIPADRLTLYSLKRKAYAVIKSHPRYLREQMQLRFIYKAFFRGRYTWVSQHIRLVEYSVSGSPVVHYGTIKEYDHSGFIKSPVCVVEFTNRARHCIMLDETGKADVLFTLNRSQLSVLHLTSKCFSKNQIAQILNTTMGAVYNNMKAIENILKESSWEKAMSKAISYGILWEFDEKSVSN